MHNASCQIIKAENISELFKKKYGSILKNILHKTSTVFKVATVNQITGRENNNYLKKCYNFYLDTQYYDHIEVFDKRGKVKAVLNLDENLNSKKTDKAISEGRRIQ